KAAIGKFWEETGLFVIDELHPELSTHIIVQVADYVENSIVAPIDRGDIGIKDCEPTNEAIENEWAHLSAARLISSCNPPFGSSKKTQMDHFMTAVQMAQLSLRGTISQGINFCRMENEVAKAADTRSQESIDYNYLVIENPGPWQAHVLGRENLNDVLYVIFPSDRGGWMVQCVPDALNSFGKRKALPKSWAGLRGEEFASKTGVKFGSATFCHPGRFVAGAETLGDAIKLASLAAAAKN
ncbi:MYG1 family protein, partial [Candidatus Pacearchaeota archaeon]|nr:MYG1 family protein [Candidatus Pacearchaeota archaeon]